jgi:hypothetical protein
VQECKAIQADGVQFALQDAWVDRIWQRQPTGMVVLLKQQPDATEDARIVRIRESLKRIDANGAHYMVEVP